MKTKIRTLLTICALAFIGIININAISDNKKTVNTEVVSEKAEMLTNETWSSERPLIYSAEAYSTIDFNGELNQYVAKQILPDENAFLYSAKAFTAIDSENETERFESNQMFPEEGRITVSDELSSAEFFTASGADREIEKYARKLVSMQQIRTGK